MAKKDDFNVFYAVSLAWQLGFLIVISIGGFLFLGFLADSAFGTNPLFLIAGIILGVIITIYGVYHMLIPLLIKTKK